MVTVPVTLPNEPPFTVTVFVPPLLVTVTLTVAADEVPPPNSRVEVVEKVLVPPSTIFWPVVLASNAHGVTVIVVGATMPGMVEDVTLKMQEP